MDRLIAAKLRHGDLLTISSRTLVDRYNRALEILCGRTTKLAQFHIDLTGFSPEVAEEFGDPLYLNPHGINRKFILLTTDQESLPVVDANFTWTEAMMRQFIADNHDPLFSLTSRDVVYGELENSTYRLRNLDDLLSIRQIHFEVRTSRKVIKRAQRLQGLIEDYQADEGAWFDEDKLDTIIALAEETGNIMRHPVTLDRTTYSFGNFYTRHFGGLYVFGEASSPTLISLEANFSRRLRKGTTALAHVPLRNTKAVRDFLGQQSLIEYAKADDPDETLRSLRQTATLILVDFLADKGLAGDLRTIDAEQEKRFVYEHFDALPKEFHAVSKVIKHMEQTGGSLPARIPNEAFFYMVRPSEHEDRDLVHHLLANFTPLDFRRTYRFNREVFLRNYQDWPDEKKDFVVAFLSQGGAARRGANRRRRASG